MINALIYMALVTTLFTHHVLQKNSVHFTNHPLMVPLPVTTLDRTLLALYSVKVDMTLSTLLHSCTIAQGRNGIISPLHIMILFYHGQTVQVSILR